MTVDATFNRLPASSTRSSPGDIWIQEGESRTTGCSQGEINCPQRLLREPPQCCPFRESGHCPNGPTVTFMFGEAGRTMKAGIGPEMGLGTRLLQAPRRTEHLV